MWLNRIIVDIGKSRLPSLPNRDGDGAGTGAYVDNRDGALGTGRLDARMLERFPKGVSMMALVPVSVVKGAQIWIRRIELTATTGNVGIRSHLRIGFHCLKPGTSDYSQERAVVVSQPASHGTMLQVEAEQIFVGPPREALAAYTAAPQPKTVRVSQQRARR